MGIKVFSEKQITDICTIKTKRLDVIIRLNDDIKTVTEFAIIFVYDEYVGLPKKKKSTRSCHLHNIDDDSFNSYNDFIAWLWEHVFEEGMFEGIDDKTLVKIEKEIYAQMKAAGIPEPECDRSF